MTDTTQTPPAKPTNARRVALITGSLTMLFGLYLMVFLVPDVLRTVAGPERMTLAQAAEVATSESHYATIEDGQWDCDTIRYIRGRSSTNSLQTTTRFTEVFLTDAANPVQIVLLASMSGELECDDLETVELTGYLTRMDSSVKQDLTNDARLARYHDASDFLEFCGYCGQENSLIGVVFGIVLTLGGLTVFLFGWRMPKTAKTDQPDM